MKIEIVNKCTFDSTPEIEAAKYMKDMLNKTIPDNLSGHIYIAANLTLCGQEVRDIDLAVWGSFIGFKWSNYYTNDTRYPKKDLVIKDFCMAIELKEHSVNKLSYLHTHIYAEYNSGKKDVTDQNEKQRYALMNYLKFCCDINVFVTNTIWLKSVSESELHNLIGNDPVGVLPNQFGFKELIDTAILQGQRPWYDRDSDNYVLSSCDNANFISIIKQHLFYERKINSELTRQKLELLTQTNAEAFVVQKDIGNGLTTLIGKAGTGKTFMLLQAALQLANKNSGRRCVLLTYNHALVSDIRRLLHYLDIPDGIDSYTIQIQTLHSFFMQLMGALGIQTNSITGSHFEAEYIKHLKELSSYVRDLMDANDIRTLKEDNQLAIDWDYVLIDEAQDWNPLEKDILVKVYGADRLIVADGGQQFIRNTRHLSWGGKEIALKIGRRQKASLVRFVNAVASEMDILWKLEGDKQLLGGRVIIRKNYDDELHSRLMAYCKQQKCENYDMLFLVPPQMVVNVNGHTYFKNFQKWKDAGFALFDGTDDRKRGLYPTKVEECRIFQYESCRGLEGWVVSCLQFDKLLEWKRDSFDNSNLSDSLALESKDEKLKKYLWMWTMLPFTRAIDRLVITLKDPDSEIGKLLKRVAEKNSDVVSWEI